EIDDLVSLLLAHSEVLLYSQSGAGKSSLIHAGLLPILGGSERCEIFLSRVQGHLPGQELLDEEYFNPYVFHVLNTWEQKKEKDQSLPSCLLPLTLRDYLQQLKKHEDEDGLPLPRILIFDQFEELFTALPQFWRQRRGFFEQVRDALSADSNLHVLF